MPSLSIQKIRKKFTCSQYCVGLYCIYMVFFAETVCKYSELCKDHKRKLYHETVQKEEAFMGRKIRYILLMVLMAGGCLLLTFVVSQGNYKSATMIYNLVFWGIIVILYLTAIIAGFFRMGKLADYLQHAADVIDSVRGNQNLSVSQKIEFIKGQPELDAQLEEFQ